jgi:hypothetical protein
LRRSIRVPAELFFPWGTLGGVIENIGEGGAFFVTDTLEGPVTEGDELELRFVPPEEEIERVYDARVLRVDRYFHEGEVFRSFAIRFERPAAPPTPGKGGD